MAEDNSDSNLEWKKSSFGEKETLTRKTNIKKALEYEAKEKKPVKSVFTLQPGELPKGLKKIRKKIRDVYDDEDEDENDFMDFPLSADNSLLNALHEDEKRQLQQQETINTTRMLENAGKMEALIMADKTTRQLGMKGLKAETINNNMQDVTLNTATYEKAIKEDVAKRLKLKGKALSERDTITLLRGIKRIQDMATAADESRLKAIEGLRIEEIVDAGKKSTRDEQVAEIILRKSGRKNKKETEKIVQKSRSKSRSTNKKELYQNKDLYRG